MRIATRIELDVCSAFGTRGVDCRLLEGGTWNDAWQQTAAKKNKAADVASACDVYVDVFLACATGELLCVRNCCPAQKSSGIETRVDETNCDDFVSCRCDHDLNYILMLGLVILSYTLDSFHVNVPCLLKPLLIVLLGTGSCQLLIQPFSATLLLLSRLLLPAEQSVQLYPMAGTKFILAD